jgi:hypothetical protein
MAENATGSTTRRQQISENAIITFNNGLYNAKLNLMGTTQIIRGLVSGLDDQLSIVQQMDSGSASDARLVINTQAGDDFTFSGLLRTQAGNQLTIEKLGAGLQRFSSVNVVANSVTGISYIHEGTLAIDLSRNGNWQTGGFRVNSAGTLRIEGFQDTSYAAAVVGNGLVVKTGMGIHTLSAAADAGLGRALAQGPERPTWLGGPQGLRGGHIGRLCPGQRAACPGLPATHRVLSAHSAAAAHDPGGDSGA